MKQLMGKRMRRETDEQVAQLLHLCHNTHSLGLFIKPIHRACSRNLSTNPVLQPTSRTDVTNPPRQNLFAKPLLPAPIHRTIHSTSITLAQVNLHPLIQISSTCLPKHKFTNPFPRFSSVYSLSFSIHYLSPSPCFTQEYFNQNFQKSLNILNENLLPSLPPVDCHNSCKALSQPRREKSGANSETPLGSLFSSCFSKLWLLKTYYLSPISLSPRLENRRNNFCLFGGLPQRLHTSRNLCCEFSYFSRGVR